MAIVATFSRRVIVRCGPLAGVPYNASASFCSKTVWRHGRLLYFELGTKYRAQTSVVLSHCIYDISMPCLIMQYKPYIVEQSCMGASCS